MTAPSALDRLVTRARRQLRRRRVEAALPRTVALAAGAVVVWALVSWFVVLPRVTGSVAGLALAAVLVTCGVIALHRIPAAWGARAADRWLDTRDRFSTALELRDSGRAAAGGLAARQVDEAEAAADGVTTLPTPPRRVGVLGVAALVLAALAVGSLWLPDRHEDERARRAAEEQAVRDAADDLRELADELAASDAGAEVAARLEEVAASLERLDAERALAELADARAELASELDPGRAARRAALDGLARELALDPVGAGASVEAQLQAAAADVAAGAADEGPSPSGSSSWPRPSGAASPSSPSSSTPPPRRCGRATLQRRPER